MRQRLAMEAARILIDSGHGDFHLAKVKAARRLGAPETRNLPANVEIEQALLEYQQLFNGSEQQGYLRALRQAALQAMRLFDAFQPRLAGSVLSGAVPRNAVVELHLFSDSPKEVLFFLMDQGIPFDEGQRTLRYMKQKHVSYPVYRFMAGDIDLELLVMPLAGLRQACRCPVDGRPMRRISLAALESMLAEGESGVSAGLS